MRRTGCDGFLGWFLGHRFQVAYTERVVVPQTMEGLGGLSALAAKTLIEARKATEKKAEFAYCSRCGTIPLKVAA